MGMGMPANAKGNFATGYGSAQVGLGEATTAYSSGELALNGHVIASAVAVKFVEAALLGVPLELHFRYMDGTTQVAGEFVTSLDGESDLSGGSRRVDASGYTIFHCYDLYRQGGTIYMGLDADPGSDGFLDYFIVYAKAEGSDA